ncbi:4354_t:CDS:2 [Entrophospora sp. SA101]|nr:4354_t:CDS:2 [Entrophospora sp. SA101]
MQTHFENRIIDTYERALKRGEVYFMESRVVKIVEIDIEFEIRLAPSLANKPIDLFVQEYGKHVILLNKYCIVPYHLVIATKEFEKQTNPLNPEDMASIWFCIMHNKSQPTLVFFNCGELSGASQPHKHIQVIPLPSEARFTPPISSYIYRAQNRKPGEIFEFEDLPYIHYVVLLDPKQISERHHQHQHGNYEEVGQYLSQNFHSLLNRMLKDFNTNHKNVIKNDYFHISYNFIMTHTWMMMVPRRSEKYEYVSINSLGFAGMLLVRNEEELKFVKTVGVMKILENVAIPKKNQ